MQQVAILSVVRRLARLSQLSLLIPALLSIEFTHS